MIFVLKLYHCFNYLLCYYFHIIIILAVNLYDELNNIDLCEIIWQQKINIYYQQSSLGNRFIQ
jgi:hypothetical protein